MGVSRMPTLLDSSICQSLPGRPNLFDISGVGVDRFIVSAFPVTISRLVYFGRAFYMPDELGAHSLKLDASDDGGNVLGPPLTQTVVPEVGPGEKAASNMLRLRLPPFDVTRAGSVTITLYIDGDRVDTLDVDVIQQPQP